MAIASRLSKLRAVNLILSGADEQPVSTLVDDGINDSDFAQQVLDDKIIEILSMGWDFNSVVKEFQFNTNGRIPISPSYVRIDGSGTDYRRRFTVRSNHLYDLDNDTDVFTENVELAVIQNLEWDDIPSPVQYYIARAAAVVYQSHTKGDGDKDQVLRVEEAKALEQAKKHNSKTGDRSWIRDTSGSLYHQSVRRTRYTSMDRTDPRPL